MVVWVLHGSDFRHTLLSCVDFCEAMASMFPEFLILRNVCIKIVMYGSYVWQQKKRNSTDGSLLWNHRGLTDKSLEYFAKHLLKSRWISGSFSFVIFIKIVNGSLQALNRNASMWSFFWCEEIRTMEGESSLVKRGRALLQLVVFCFNQSIFILIWYFFEVDEMEDCV